MSCHCFRELYPFSKDLCSNLLIFLFVSYIQKNEYNVCKVTFLTDRI